MWLALCLQFSGKDLVQFGGVRKLYFARNFYTKKKTPSKAFAPGLGL